jgi:hypothetical protein
MRLKFTKAMIPILRLVHILYTVEFVYSEQAYNEVKINRRKLMMLKWLDLNVKPRKEKGRGK